MNRWPFFFSLLVLGHFTSAASTAPPSKRVWQLTDEERIALRIDPRLAQARMRESGRIHATSAQPEGQQFAYAFNGKTHPELFLPHEVFRQLIELAFAGPPRMGQIARDGFMPQVKQHGLPPDFWARLESISAVYVSDLLVERDLTHGSSQQDSAARGRAKASLILKRDDVCRSRAEAFAAAGKEFGRERFDRFLYEVVATGMFHEEDRVPDPEMLRRTAGGCR